MAIDPNADLGQLDTPSAAAAVPVEMLTPKPVKDLAIQDARETLGSNIKTPELVNCLKEALLGVVTKMDGVEMSPYEYSLRDDLSPTSACSAVISNQNGAGRE